MGGLVLGQSSKAGIYLGGELLEPGLSGLVQREGGAQLVEIVDHEDCPILTGQCGGSLVKLVCQRVSHTGEDDRQVILAGINNRVASQDIPQESK